MPSPVSSRDTILQTITKASITSDARFLRSMSKYGSALNDSDTYITSQVARVLGVGQKRIREMVRTGQLHRLRGFSRPYRFAKTYIDKLAEKEPGEPSPRIVQRANDHGVAPTTLAPAALERPPQPSFTKTRETGSAGDSVDLAYVERRLQALTALRFAMTHSFALTPDGRLGVLVPQQPKSAAQRITRA